MSPLRVVDETCVFRRTERLMEDILVDAYGEDEQLWAFLQTFEEEVPLPAEGTVNPSSSVVRIQKPGQFKDV
jgi:hypothetical protein